jgi:putative tryptophan/tyrosine transport system substrate-binding protein
MSHMRRRSFITLLGGAAAAWPLAARAQQGERARRVGVLMAWLDDDPDILARVAAFRQELRKLGWSEGANFRLEERFGGDDMDRLRAQAAELIELKPDAILVGGRRAVSVLRQQTRSIPIVLAGISDPAGQGLVASLARPGGNITGFSMFEFSVIGKMLEILKQTAPGIAGTALIYNPDNPATDLFVLPAFERAASALGVQPSGFAVHDAAEIERAIEASGRLPNHSLFFPPDVTVVIHRELISALVARHRLPAIYSDPVLVRSGGLMSYSPDRLDIFRRAASYVDRILRGEKPGDLPVQQPVKFELVVNLKAAKALELTVPDKLLVAADEVIE